MNASDIKVKTAYLVEIDGGEVCRFEVGSERNGIFTGMLFHREGKFDTSHGPASISWLPASVFVAECQDKLWFA